MGDYAISVEVKDKEGASAKSGMASVYAGNEEPVVSIQKTTGNKSFYLPGKSFGYAVSVKDNDTAKMDEANLFVSVDYMQGLDKAGATMGHQQGQALVSGKSLTQSLDCKTCHKEAEKSIGPSFLQVAEKYQKDPNATAYLSEKIIKGGKGVWGETAMAPHATLAQSDVQQIVAWILSLGNKAKTKKSLPATGTVVPVADQRPNTALVLTASYTDKGSNSSKALTGSNSIVLRSNKLAFTGTEEKQKFTSVAYGGMNLMLFPQDEGWFVVDGIDLTDVRSVNAAVLWQNAPEIGIDLEARLDSPTGKLIGKGSMPVPAKKQPGGLIRLPVEAVTDGEFHKIYFIYKPRAGGGSMQAALASLEFNAK